MLWCDGSEVVRVRKVFRWLLMLLNFVSFVTKLPVPNLWRTQGLRRLLLPYVGDLKPWMWVKESQDNSKRFHLYFHPLPFLFILFSQMLIDSVILHDSSTILCGNTVLWGLDSSSKYANAKCCCFIGIFWDRISCIQVIFVFLSKQLEMTLNSWPSCLHLFQDWDSRCVLPSWLVS